MLVLLTGLQRGHELGLSSIMSWVDNHWPNRSCQQMYVFIGTDLGCMFLL
jgi:hypothetical protein